MVCNKYKVTAYAKVLHTVADFEKFLVFYATHNLVVTHPV